MKLPSIANILGTNKVKVLAGSIPAGEYTLIESGILSNADTSIDLAHTITQVTEQSSTDAKNFMLAGLALPFVFVAPVLALIGAYLAVKAGTVHNVCVLVQLSDGRKFVAVCNADLFHQMKAYVLAQ